MIVVKTTTILDEFMTLWGEPEQVHMQNVDQVHAQVYLQNVTEPVRQQDKRHCQIAMRLPLSL